MTSLVRLEGNDGAVLFEANVSEHRLQEIGVMDGVIEGIDGAAQKLTDAIGTCLEMLNPVFEHEVKKPQSKLDKAEVSFGISVNGEGNVYVVKLSGSANLQVKLTWSFGADAD